MRTALIVKQVFPLGLLFLLCMTDAAAQRKPDPKQPVPATNAIPVPPASGSPSPISSKSGPKAFKDVITDKAKTMKGLFIVHKVDDKYYFEIPDSIMGRDIMAITRFSKVAGGGGVYGGELANQQVIRFEKGPDNKVFTRVITVISVANDSTQPIYKAVRNSNVDPIASAMDVKAFSRDSSGVVVDITDYFKGDNLPVSLNAGAKRRLNLGSLASDRSYIESIRSYPDQYRSPYR